MMIGVAIWSVVKNGFGIFAFFPLIFGYLFRNNKTDYEEVKKEIQSRETK